jgi:hypothetical protein
MGEGDEEEANREEGGRKEQLLIDLPYVNVNLDGEEDEKRKEGRRRNI